MTTSPAPVALAIGDEMPTSQFGPLTRSHIVRYAGSGGDFNPIHHLSLIHISEPTRPY